MELALALVINILMVIALALAIYYSSNGKSALVNPNKQETNHPIQSQTASFTGERVGLNPQVRVSDPNRTTSRLVGNGLAYFVFWFFGAPILTLVVFIFLFMWIRWTIPRFRYDQLINLGWKTMIPMALFILLITGALILANL